jgi:ABC-type transport system involved in cytochrome bd biosynthesis fused ATPase/permease subunit
MVWGVGNTSPVNALLAWLGWLFALLLLLALLFVLFIIPVLRRSKKPDVQRPRVAY